MVESEAGRKNRTGLSVGLGGEAGVRERNRGAGSAWCRECERTHSSVVQEPLPRVLFRVKVQGRQRDAELGEGTCTELAGEAAV